VGDNPIYLKFSVNRPHWNEIADFEPRFVHSASAVTHSKKVQLTLMGSPFFLWKMSATK